MVIWKKKVSREQLEGIAAPGKEKKVHKLVKS